MLVTSGNTLALVIQFLFSSLVDMRLVRMRKSPYGICVATGSILLVVFVMYTLVFSRGHEKRVDVEQMLESYINSRLESRSSQVTRDCVVIVKHVQ